MATTVLDHIGNTPMVTLTKIGRDLPVPIVVKCEHLNPGGSVKVAAVRVASSGRVRGPVVALLPDSWDRYLSQEWPFLR